MSKYSAKLLYYFYHLDHAGSLLTAKKSTIGSAEQGDFIELFLFISEEKIQQARFQCFGSVPSLAACEFVCRWLEGKTSREAEALTIEKILLELQLSERHNHVAYRVLHCVKEALYGNFQS